MTDHAVSNFGAASITPNAIYIVEMGGLRIVHFGDFGQDQLPAEKLSTLGTVDVAISLLGNARTFQQILDNKTMFTLKAQVKPKLIIPTEHCDIDSIGYAAQQWQGFYSTNNPVTIGRSDLTDETRLLVLGPLAVSYQKIYSLQLWESLMAAR
jgi:hypothetical protein